MSSHDRRALIDGFSQELIQKEHGMSQLRSLYNLDQNNWDQDEFSDTMKIFVGGLPGDLTLDEFKAYFEQFGSIQDAVVMRDKLTNRPRGFGFVTFDSPEAANHVILNRFYELKNKRIEVKKAVSKDQMSRNFLNNWYVYDAMYSFGDFGGYGYWMNGYEYGAYNGCGYEGLLYGYYPYRSPYHSLYGSINTYSYQSPYNYGIPPYSSRVSSYRYSNRTPIVVKNPNLKDGDHSDVARKNASLLREKGKTDIVHLVESNGKGSVVKEVSEYGDYGESVVKDVSENGDHDEIVVKDVSENGDHGESVVKDVLDNRDHGKSAAKDVLEHGGHGKIIEVLSLCCNGEADGDGDGDGNGGYAEFIEAINLYRDRLGKQMGADGQSSSYAADS